MMEHVGVTWRDRSVPRLEAVIAFRPDQWQPQDTPPRRPAANNGPRGQRGLARPSKAGLTCEGRTSRSRWGASEEHGKPRATEDLSLDTLRDPLYGAPFSLPERGRTYPNTDGGPMAVVE